MNDLDKGLPLKCFSKYNIETKPANFCEPQLTELIWDMRASSTVRKENAFRLSLISKTKN